MNHKLFPLGAVLLIAAGGLGGYTLNLTVDQPAAATAAGPLSAGAATSFASAIDAGTTHAYDTASPSVVYINNVGTGTGPGVIYDGKGDIVTNAHVVRGATKLSVTLSNGKTFPARLVGTDAADDLAVIHIHASGLIPAHFAASGAYQVAQTVLAIGSPLGLKQSVTSGLISGLNRTEQEPNGAYLPSAIQTSAPINPGNSGGALVTLDGTVVGIPTLEETSAQNGSMAQGIGFAIAAPRVTLVANQIIATGKVQHTDRPYLGVSLGDAASGALTPFGGGFGQGGGQSIAGAAVSQVAPNSPAGRAGIQPGDVITKFGGQTITSSDDLLAALATEKPGSTVSVTVNRNGSSQTFKLHLSELPATQ